MEVSKDLGRQLRRLQRSRTLWQDRAGAKQGHILYLRVRIRDLEVSRNSWKQRALAAEALSATVAVQPNLAAVPPQRVPGES
jgi:hypothetical protein